jgi:hypothetical protein
MDPITVIVIVIIAGGTSTAAGVNPIYTFFGIIGVLLALCLPFAAVYATYMNSVVGTLSLEQIGAAIWVIGNLLCFIIGMMADDLILPLLVVFNILFILICIYPILIWVIPITIIGSILFFIFINK